MPYRAPRATSALDAYSFSASFCAFFAYLANIAKRKRKSPHISGPPLASNAIQPKRAAGELRIMPGHGNCRHLKLCWAISTASHSQLAAFQLVLKLAMANSTSEHKGRT